MKIQIVNKMGEKVEDLTMSNAFEYVVSPELLTLYVNYLRNATRDPIANSKDRSDVSGGGRKPYKQKGTGNARAGSTRSPLWVGGGVTFGPSSDQNWHKKITKKAKKQVMAGVIGEAIKSKKAIGIDELSFETPKTKEALQILNNLNVDSKTVVIYCEKDDNAGKSLRNISGIVEMYINKLNVLDILSSKKVILTKEALLALNDRYSKEK